jgi:isoquinoline 1-oxidoreductase subunit alpha
VPHAAPEFLPAGYGSVHTVPTFRLRINNADHEVTASEAMPLLWVLRDRLGLTGTKFGCGAAQCGACTVLVGDDAIRSCITPAHALRGQPITTIEGLSPDRSHPMQRAWIAEDVPQCGYCQAGQIMNAVGLLRKLARPSDADIDAAMAGNICRCGTYNRIRKAIRRASEDGKPVGEERTER